MTSIIEKRRSLHRHLAEEKGQNKDLKLQVGQLQALANIGVTTCMIAHEINNLLTPLSNYAELALCHPEDRQLTEKAFQKTWKNCKRISKIMQTILAVADGEEGDRQEVGLRALVDEIFTCLCRDFSKDRISVKIDIAGDLTVWAVPVQIQQVLMNLILNAREAMLGSGGTLSIKAANNGESVQILVADTGVGIEAANLRKIFEPFFTTKKGEKSSEQTSGSGLGLAFCKKIVEEHDGSICVESRIGEGAVFEISLPSSQ